MIDKSIGIQQEKKDKNKARKIALILHSFLILGFVVPFLNSKINEQPVYEQVVTIDFEDFKSAAAKSSTRKASPAATKAVETPKKKPVVKPQPPKPTPKPKPTPPVAKHKPVITAPSPERPPIKTAPVIKNVPTPEPRKVEVVKIPEPEPVKEEVPDEEFIDEPVEEVVEAEAPPVTETAEAPGAASEAGEGDFGTSETGKAETDGKAEKGDSGNDFSGDGLLTRKVTYRADVKKLTKEEGKIVINICVSQQGSVTFSEYNQDESTIYDADLVVKAKKTASKYKFEKDYTAPRKQCGKLTFTFEIE